MDKISRDTCIAAYTLLHAEDRETARTMLKQSLGLEADAAVSEAERIISELEERYGEARETMLSELASMCTEYINDVVSQIVSSRDLLLLAAFFAKNQFYPVPLAKLRTYVEMMSLDVDIDSLIRKGVLLRISENDVAMPAFVESLVLQPYCDLSLDEVIENIQQNHILLSVLEAYVDGKSPEVELFEKLYGVTYEDALARVSLHRVAKFCPETRELVMNPCIDLYELREKLHEFKKARARNILRQLDVTMGYGKYSRRLGALSHVIAFGPGVHGILLSAPWLVPTRGLERYMSNIARLIITCIPFRREFAEYFHQLLEQTSTFRKTAFAFLQEGVVYLVAPERRDKVLDSMIDFLYRCGLEVLEF